MSTYLIQAIVGLGITMIAALNYGNIYENEFGFAGDKSFGLTIAALGFLSASIGGVIHLNVMKKKGRLILSRREDGSLHSDKVESDNEIPMQESMDKMTVQIAPIFVAYVAAYLLMAGLGALVPGMKSIIFGFNFLLGVITAHL
ncbi:MAG: hypothetical protein BHV88_13310 [Clostridiales bacterium 41_12_two_minus]|nr:MAG: hypothetical protein BHV88_13310 [Clostridiales bacterium 41_12_two_minus]